MLAPPRDDRSIEVARIPNCYFRSLVIESTTAYVACVTGEVYAAPFGSPPKVIARGARDARLPLVIEGTRLFFRSKDNEISVMPTAGGGAVAVLSGLRPLSLDVAGGDLIVTALQYGIVRIPLGGGNAQFIAQTTDATGGLAVGNGAVYFLGDFGAEQHAYSASLMGSAAIDLGPVPRHIRQIAVAGGTLFAGEEIDLASLSRKSVGEDRCTAFVSDGAFVFAACFRGGIVGRKLTSSTWYPVVHVRVTETLALTATRVCWADHGQDDATDVRCVARPDGLR